MMRVILTDFQILSEIENVFFKASMLIEDGMIMAIHPTSKTQQWPFSTASTVSSNPIIPVVSDDAETQIIDCQGGTVIPGMIDLHIHGANGFDMMDGTVESIEKVSTFLASTGCTGFLATSVTSSLSDLNRFIDKVKVIAGRENGAKILGLHLEGPYLNPLYKGMQNEAFLRHPDIEEMEAILKRANGLVKMVTVAPELPGGMELVSYLSKRGIVVAIAHSDANYDVAKHAFQLGARHVTHCFNAMRPIHHREPGVVVAAFEESHVSCQAIVDNIHLHPAIIRLMHKNLGAKRMVLVTDAMQAMGMNDGEYRFGGHDVTVSDGVARLSDGTLASSTITMDRTLQTAVADDIPLTDAIRMTSTTPSSILGLTDTGVIAPGIPADLVLLNHELSVQWTMVNGHMHLPRRRTFSN